MKSEIKIDYIDRGNGRGLEPIIRVERKPSDDPRDKLITSLFQSIQGQFLQLYYANMKFTSTKDGELESDKTIYLFKPDESEVGYFNVFNNSHAFRQWLTDEGIDWKQNEHHTLVAVKTPESFMGACYHAFELGVAWEKYREQNEPKKSS